MRGTERAVLAVDIGGTKLAAGVVDATGEVLAQRQGPSVGAASAEALFERLVGLCRAVLADVGGAPVAAIGVGCGGPMRYPEGVVSPLNIPVWRAFPLRERLAEVFGLPCIVDNDAKAMALGERWRGAGQEADNMLGMVVSTGVGGGLVVDGRLLHGEHGNAGHIGHIVVWPAGPACGCGARGCVEAIASGSGLARRVVTALTEGAETTLQAGATAADVAAAARAGDALARTLFREAGEAVGRGIAATAALVDLQVAVVGGSIALRAWDLLAPPLEAELRRCAQLDFTREVRVVPAALGADAGLVGAAALALTGEG